MAKYYEKKLDSGTRNAITEQINVYINSIKEDIGYDEFDKVLEKDAIIEQLMDYYAANPLDDTMSYDDWVNNFIDGNNLRENRYKSQFKDYLRNIVAIIYSNISEVEYDPEKKESAAKLSNRYEFSDYIHISSNDMNFRISIAQNDVVTHHMTNVPTSIGRSYKNRDIIMLRAQEKLHSAGRIYLEDDSAGSGKKTFAKELYHDINPKYDHCAWIRLDSDLRQSILDSMSIYPATSDVDTRYAQIIAFIRAKRNKILFCIDNSFGYYLTEDESKFLDELNVDIIFINNPGVGRAEAVALGSMPLDQCIDIFYEYYTLDKAHKFIEIIEEYIELAGKNLYLIKLLAKSAKGYNLAEYLHRLRNDGFTQLNMTGLDADSAAVLVCRNIIKLCKVANLNENQYDILKYFAVMPDIDIPEDIVTALEFSKDDMATLVKLGMVDCHEKTNYGTVYSIHPLMRQTMHMQFDLEPENCKKLINLIITGKYIKSNESFALFMKKLKIARGVLAEFEHDRFDEKGELFNAVACWLFQCGEYHKALEFCTKAVNIREKIPVVNHPSTAVVYDNISRIYTAVGEDENAVDYGKKAIDIYEKYHDSYNIQIAGICTSVADSLVELGEYDEALENYNRALAIREKEAANLSLANIYSKLGALYNEIREPEKAIEFHNKALKIKEKIVGLDSPMTAATYNSLALIYKEQGDFDKALDFNHKTLRIRERVLGSEHPLTARTHNHLGRIYLNKGDYNKALESYVKAYKIFRHIYGEDHAQTRIVKENLEATYRRSFEKWLADQLK